MKHSDPVFGPRRNWKYSELKEYTENLETCLGTAKSVKHLTMTDLTWAISEKVGGSVANDVEDENNIAKPGEQIVVYWVENEEVVWYLDIVEKVQRDCVMVIHLKQSDKKGNS